MMVNLFNSIIYISYTMMGSNESEFNDSAGVIPRICMNLLQELASKELNIEGSVEKLLSAKLFVSFLEIYNERVLDLLSQNPGSACRVREHPQNGAYVESLTKVKVEDFADILSVLSEGKRKRQVASTLMNSESSRSHAVFTIYLIQELRSVEEFERVSKVSLVDLAGSERINSTGVTGDRLKEATNINKSLSTLGDVINALSEKSDTKESFIPYRNSTLTWLLKDSLGGNSKTTMLATISPSDGSYGESMSTLRYIERAKLIVNKVSVNESHWENPQIALLQKQLSELNAKYLELVKLHQKREKEFEEFINTLKYDLEEKYQNRLKEITDYSIRLENMCGMSSEEGLNSNLISTSPAVESNEKCSPQGPIKQAAPLINTVKV